MILEQQAKVSLDKYTIIALLIGLVAYPVLYSNDFFSSLFLPMLPSEWTSSLYSRDERVGWWYFIASNLFYHWMPFLFVWYALVKNHESWHSVGVDWSWFARYKLFFITLIVILVLSAFIVPHIYYQGELPSRSQAGFVGPISTLERLAAIIVLAFTAAVTEEVIFRGFALTRLQRCIRNPWFILPVIAVSFVFIHGGLRSIGLTLNYLIFSLVFGACFILLRFKRLEILILIHFLINASLVFVP
ncbi:CPBP family intramembrane metalloprotease [Rheinheimera muenzenbergensis]|uniref:CPBP family intramembrane metalloprotease n=1 Tax=Rheinheimera muenzenbergensis TaxID=1193628 RepID=A0ABU8C6E5_9GAMM